MAKNDFQYAGWNSYTLQLWLDHNIDFVRWLHPAVWHVAVESWQWIHQVAAPCDVTRGCAMTCHWIRQNVRHIGILHYGFHFHTSPQSTCHYVPVCEILFKSDHPQQKKMTSCRFSRWRISAILDCRDPLKSLCTTSYRSSTATTALNCLVFEKIALFACSAGHWTQLTVDNDGVFSFNVDKRSECLCSLLALLECVVFFCVKIFNGVNF